MKFSPLIIELSEKVYRSMIFKVSKQRKRLPIIGLHLRLEDDWIAFEQSYGTLESILSWRLDQYDEQIEFIKKETNSEYAIYAAHGEFKDGNYSKMIDAWLANHSNYVFRKSDFLSEDDYDVWTSKTDIRGAIDYEVLTKVDHFVGNAVSSFTWAVSERRSLDGKPSLFMRRPGYGHWWPIYVPRWNNWYKISDRDPSVNDPKPFRMKSFRESMDSP